MDTRELRNNILSISITGPIGALPIFAASKVIDPYLEPKGRWRYASAAISHDTSLRDRLNYIGNPFDDGKMESDKEYRQTINNIVEALRDLPFDTFLQNVVPELIPNPDYLSKLVLDCAFKKPEYEALAVMQARLEWTSSGNADFACFKKGCANAKEIVSYSKVPWEEFIRCVNAYPLKYKQNTPTTALKINETFKKYYIPFRARISLFCDIREQISKDKGKSKTLVVGKSLADDKSINHWNVQLAINETRRRIAKITPTDALKELWTEKPETNDSKLDVDFFLRKVLVCARTHPSVLIVNPSPSFLEKACAQDEFSNILTYAMPFAETIPLLAGQFPNSQFIDFEHLKTPEADAKHYACAWLFSQGIPAPELECLMECIYGVLNSKGQFYAVVPSSIITYQDDSMKSALHKNFSMKRIDTFGAKVFMADPKKRVLTYATKDPPNGSDITVRAYNVTSFCGTEYLFLDKKKRAKLSPTVLGPTTKTINTLLADAQRKASAHRESAKELKFLPDISIWSTTLEAKEQENYYRVRGYIAHIATEKQKKRNIQPRGKRINEYIVTSPLLAEDAIEEWRTSVLPYKSRIQDGIKMAIDTAKPSPLSLKTLWYLQADFSKNPLESAAFNYELTLFSSEVGLLTGQEDRELFTDCVNRYLDQINADFKERRKSWYTIYKVCNTGVERGVIDRNPATTVYNELRSMDVDEEYAELRDNLAKKTFTFGEEKRLIQILKEKVKTDPIFLSVLIRLFTGLPVRVVAALKWKDVEKSLLYNNAFHFLVRREIDNCGKPKRFEVLEAYRKVPIVPLLKEQLDARKDHILASGRIKSRALAEIPIVATDEQLLSGSDVRINVRAIRKAAKEALSTLNIQDVIVTLPDKDGRKHLKNLTQYRGDIFASNFKTRVRSVGLLEREVNYLCGLRQKSTYDRHYCDYTNPLTQALIYVKLLRWDSALQYLPFASRVTQQDISLIENHAEFSVEGTASAEIELSLTGKAVITVESQHGIDLFGTIVA